MSSLSVGSLIGDDEIEERRRSSVCVCVCYDE